MKNFYYSVLLSALVFIPTLILSQTNPSAIMDIESTDKGLLIPRMTTAQRTAISTPAKGLLVFDNTTNSFWFYNGSIWVNLEGGVQGPAGADGAPGIQGPAGADGAPGVQGPAGDSHWLLNGNDTYFSSGKVGIGTNAPQRLLHLKGNGGIFNLEGDNHSYLQFYPDGYGAGRKAWIGFGNATTSDFSITNQFTDGGINLNVNGTTRMHIQENGNIGIGTANPTERLEIAGNGNIKLSSGNTFTRLNSYTAADGKSTIYQIDPTPADNTGYSSVRLFRSVNSSANQSFVIMKGNNTTATNHKLSSKDDSFLSAISGKVGIGTTTPEYSLHVKGGGLLVDGGWLRVKGSGGIFFEDYGGGFNMTEDKWIRVFNGKSFFHQTGIMRTDGQFQVGPNGNRFLVNTDGNVGIGITNPGAQLHVSTANLASTDIGLRVGGNGDVAIDASGVIGGRMIIKDNGKVGIGTESPVQKFHVNGGHIRAGISLNEYSEFGHGGSHGFINTIGDGNLEFRHDNSTKMKLTDSGKLIIGNTPTPGNYLLYVEKGILTEHLRAALKTSSRWADDAFGNKPDLKELEQFIQEKSHLIGMPSADELVKTGIDVVEMDANLLRQIEWLWEYTIQTNKEKEALQAKNEELEKRVARIEQLLKK